MDMENTRVKRKEEEMDRMIEEEEDRREWKRIRKEEKEQ